MNFEIEYGGSARGEAWSPEERAAFERLPDNVGPVLAQFPTVLPSEMEASIKQSAIKVDLERRKGLAVAGAKTQDEMIGARLSVIGR